MRKLLRSPLDIGIIIVLVIIALAVAGYRFQWDWTGLPEHISPKVPQNQQYQPAKTAWDWLQLLFVPIILAIGGFWLNQIQKDRDERIAEKRAQTERKIAEDNQREAALQAYIDKMSE